MTSRLVMFTRLYFSTFIRLNLPAFYFYPRHSPGQAHYFYLFPFIFYLCSPRLYVFCLTSFYRFSLLLFLSKVGSLLLSFIFVLYVFRLPSQPPSILLLSSPFTGIASLLLSFSFYLLSFFSTSLRFPSPVSTSQHSTFILAIRRDSLFTFIFFLLSFIFLLHVLRFPSPVSTSQHSTFILAIHRDRLITFIFFLLSFIFVLHIFLKP